jgi:hypothetical protein
MEIQAALQRLDRLTATYDDRTARAAYEAIEEALRQPPAPAVDLEVLVRSLTDSTQNWESTRDLALKAVKQASWMRRRGVHILLDGDLFEPGALSPHEMEKLIDLRKWLEEE